MQNWKANTARKAWYFAKACENWSGWTVETAVLKYSKKNVSKFHGKRAW